MVAQPGCDTVQTGHGTSQLTVVGTECDTTQADKDTVAAPECDRAKTDWGTAQTGCGTAQKTAVAQTAQTDGGTAQETVVARNDGGMVQDTM